MLCRSPTSVHDSHITSFGFYLQQYHYYDDTQKSLTNMTRSIQQWSRSSDP